VVRRVARIAVLIGSIYVGAQASPPKLAAGCALKHAQEVTAHRSYKGRLCPPATGVGSKSGRAATTPLTSSARSRGVEERLRERRNPFEPEEAGEVLDALRDRRCSDPSAFFEGRQRTLIE
jgi:hypothetical protein